MYYSVNEGRDGWKLKAELVGDLDENMGAPDLSNYILYIPAEPETAPMVQDYLINLAKLN